MSEPSGFERVPPQDVVAEKATIGAMLMSREAVADVAEVLSAEHYYRPAHALIHDAIMQMFGYGEVVDAITVLAELTKRGEASRVGGGMYLHECIEATPTAASAAHYATIVRDKAINRGLVEAGQAIEALGYRDGDAVAGVATAEGIVASLDSGISVEDYERIDAMVGQTVEELQALEDYTGRITGLPCGIMAVDVKTGGFQPGQLVVIAARPAMGKSIFALDIMRSCALREGDPAILFSLEMGNQEISKRLLAAEATVKYPVFKGQVPAQDTDWTRIAKVVGEVGEAPLYVDDSPNMTMAAVRAKCRRVKSQHGGRLGAIGFDYLQLASGSKPGQSRQEFVAELSRALKLLGKEMGCPVFAVSQLNRGNEQRTDKKPQMSDLRESGAIEQDADIIMLLHREDYYDQDNRPGEVDVIIAKHRGGETGTVTCVFQGHYMRIVEMP